MTIRDLEESKVLHGRLIVVSLRLYRCMIECELMDIKVRPSLKPMMHIPLYFRTCFRVFPPDFRKIYKFPPLFRIVVHFHLFSQYLYTSHLCSFNLLLWIRLRFLCFPLFCPCCIYPSCFRPTRIGRPYEHWKEYSVKSSCRPILYCTAHNAQVFLAKNFAQRDRVT